jgi:hypothetical protein
MRIFIPTSNDYTRYCEITCALLEKYWPDHPPVDVAHFENAPQVPGGFNRLYCGTQAHCRKWVHQFMRYLATVIDDYILVMLDDYALFQPPNRDAIDNSLHFLRQDRMLCGIALTWQPCPKLPFNDGRPLVHFPKWPYSINLQASIWRTRHLYQILVGCRSEAGQWDFEQTASHWFHTHLFHKRRIAGWNCPEPANPSDFVDSVDKTGWVLAYHNLCRRRQPDHRHDAFLQAEGFTPWPAS